MVMSRIPAAVAAAALLLGLTACGLPAPPATPEPGATDVTSPPEAPLASGDRPLPSADIDCDDLTNPAQLDPLFAVPVDLAGPGRTGEYIGASIAEEWTIRQAGGIACEWSDPEGLTTSEGRYHAVLQVRLLAASGPQWQQFSDAVGDGSDRWTECQDYGWCTLDQYTETGWWLSIAADRLDESSGTTVGDYTALTSPVFEAIAATVEGLPAPDPAWSFPALDLAFGGGCEGVTTASRLATAVGVSAPLDYEQIDFPRQATAARLLVGGSDCRWVRSADGWDVAFIEVLPGGAWAQAEAKAAMEGVGATVPSPAVPGVPAGATALYEHVDSWAMDVVLGGTWIKISIGNGSDTGGMSSPDALAAIAADIAAHS